MTWKRVLMMMVAAACAMAMPMRQARAEFAPRVAIVMCKDTQAEDWYAAHSGSQAMVGLAGLVGVSYRTLTLEQYLAEASPAYTSIWFGDCAYIAEERIEPLSIRLQEHVLAGGSVFLSSPLGILYTLPNGDVRYRGMADSFSYLGVVDRGWYPLHEYRIHTTDSSHDIAIRAGHAAGAPLSQGIEDGIETMGLVGDAPGSEVLLELVAPDTGSAHPFLVVSEPMPGAKVAAIGSYGTYAGPAAPFRNEEPAGFYDNQVLPYLIQTLLWLIGPRNEPFATLLLSHAPMTAIGRLDGDWSGDPVATDLTFDYLIEVGKQTGLATVYGIVSGYPDADGWDVFRTRGPELEGLGGSIGTHSRSHHFDMSELPSPQEWKTEVADSLQQIRNELTGTDYAPDAQAFINPGNTIHNSDYGKFFDAIELYMTHGIETTPYASGVMGFDLPDGMKLKPVINNTPMPDFQWLYETGWLYTVEEAASLQARLLDYYQDTVGRGVLYNQMWHDYAISDGVVPLHYPDTETSRPLFDANRAHFASNRVYMPSIDELVVKMHAAHAVELASTSTGQELVVSLDYSAVQRFLPEHVAGMGVRVNGNGSPIQSVQVDGEAHHGFTSDTVILPPAQGSAQTVSITLGDTPEPAEQGARLTYISKPFQAISRQAEYLDIALHEPGQPTRFCMVGPRTTVVLHASAYRMTSDQELCGHLVHGSSTRNIGAQVLDIGIHVVAIVAAQRPISSASYHDHAISLEVAAGEAADIEVETPEWEVDVQVDGKPGQITPVEGGFTVTIPPSSSPVVVTIGLSSSCVDDDGDGISTCAGDCDDEDPTGVGDCTGVMTDTAGCGCAVAPRDRHHGLALLWLVAAAMLLWRRRR